jgi:hypothetical protein
VLELAAGAVGATVTGAAVQAAKRSIRSSRERFGTESVLGADSDFDEFSAVFSNALAVGRV